MNNEGRRCDGRVIEPSSTNSSSQPPCLLVLEEWCDLSACVTRSSSTPPVLLLPHGLRQVADELQQLLADAGASAAASAGGYWPTSHVVGSSDSSANSGSGSGRHGDDPPSNGVADLAATLGWWLQVSRLERHHHPGRLGQ